MSVPRLSARLLAVALGLAAASGCRATPALDGESLRCDDTCPQELRCVDGVCISNSAPTFAPVPAMQQIAAQAFALQLEVSDADDDPITVRWTQPEGPTGVLTGLETTEVTLTLPALGLYVFEVMANDGFDDSEPLRIPVTAYNLVPEVSGLRDLFTCVNEVIELTPQITDLDGHGFSAGWTQTIGPAVTLTPGAGHAITFTPLELGLHQFELTVSEPLPEFGGSVTVARVMVEPGQCTTSETSSVIYVSQAGDSEEGCGTLGAPCPSLNAGIAAAEAAGLDVVFVAAAAEPYAECIEALEAAGPELYGAYDPITWVHRDTLRAATRFDCAGAEGHRIGGTTLLRDLSLRSTVVGPVPRAATLTIEGGTARLVDVDVTTANCLPGCEAVGVASVDASPVLQGVVVQSGSEPFTSVTTFTGIHAVGGAPVIEPSEDDSVDEPGRPSVVVLDAQVDAEATGILLARTGDGTQVRWVFVAGGLGAALYGVTVAGGTAEVTNSRVDISTFGTHTVAGLRAVDCSGAAPPCDCPIAACAPPGAGPFTPALTATTNTVDLHGAGPASNLVPCTGAGIEVRSAAQDSSLIDNDVTFDGAFHRAIGIHVDHQGATEGPGIGVVDNSVVIGPGRDSAFCDAVTPPLIELGAASLGLLVQGGVGGTFVDNLPIQVAAHTQTVLGLAFVGDEGSRVEGNEVLVGGGAAGSRGPLGIGGVLAGGALGPAPGLLARNQLRVADGVIESRGLLVRSPNWRVENNLIDGGDGVYSGGIYLDLAPDAAGQELPALVHNTVYGGGALNLGLGPNRTLVSRAVVFDPLMKADALGYGALVGNLLDAGDGHGLRFVFHNPGGVFFNVRLLNRAQIVTQNEGPTPVYAFNPIAAALVGGGAADNFGAGAWAVVLAGSGEVRLLEAGDPPRSLLSQPIGGAPSAVWEGLDRRVPRVVLVVDGDVAVGGVENRQVLPFARYTPRAVGGAPVVTRAAAAAPPAVGQPPSIYLVGSVGGSPDALWALPAAAGGFAAARPFSQQLPAADPIPVALDADPRSLDLWIAATSAIAPTLRLYRCSPQCRAGGNAGVMSAPVPTGTPAADLVSLRAVDLGEEATLGGDKATDFILVERLRVRVVYVSADSGTLPVPEQVIDQPCGAGVPIGAVSYGPIAGVPAFGEHDLVIGCAQAPGRLRVYRFIGDSYTTAARDQIDTGAPIAALAVGGAGALATKILVAHPAPGGDPRLRELTYAHTTGFNPPPPPPPALVLTNDVFWVDGGGRLTPTFNPGDFYAGGVAEPPYQLLFSDVFDNACCTEPPDVVDDCALGLRAAGGLPGDLWLDAAAGPNVCADDWTADLYAPFAAPAVDVDDGPRSAPFDTGADEL